MRQSQASVPRTKETSGLENAFSRGSPIWSAEFGGARLFLSGSGFSPYICLSFASGKEFLFIFLRMGLEVISWLKITLLLMGSCYRAGLLTEFSCFVPDLDARPWDFQAEECALRANIERFNARRYDRTHSNPDFLPVDNCLQSVLGQRVDLPEDFQMNYDLWLEREVFSKPISWEELLQ